MKIALCQLNFHIGNFDSNVSKIISNLELAKAQGADLAVFPELAVCAYPPQDFLEFEDFIRRCIEGIEKVAVHSTDIAVIIGGPSKNPRKEGKDLFNSAYFLNEGKIVSVHHKALLPNYDIFDEYRYFEPARNFKCVEFRGKKIALTICEDLWDIEENLMYTQNPMDELVKEDPDFMINIAASPFSYRHAEERNKVMVRNTTKYNLPLFYVNHAGAQTQIIFDGGSLVMDEKGKIIDELNYFSEDLRLYEIEKENIRKISSAKRSVPGNKISRIHNALVTGIRDYFSKLGFRQAILGLSGGIDSAVVCALACEALGAENVRGILLPSKFSSEHSLTDAEQLAKNTGCVYDTIPIADVVEEFEKTLDPFFEGTRPGIAEENLQARSRGVLLMALSNKFGYILLNTTNKSEAAVGYGTLYGDMCGGLAVLGDVYKTEVYGLAEYINREKEIIPRNTIIKPPSAELRPGQKDTDSLPEYSILDPLLFEYIENRKGPRELIEMGFEESLVRRVLKMVNTNEYKRAQAPPILRVSPKAFGTGRRLPIVGKYLG